MATVMRSGGERRLRTPTRRQFAHERRKACCRRLAEAGGPVEEAARSHGATPAQVALAWLLHRSPVTLPIPGTSSLAHFEENLEAGELELSAEELEALG